MKALGLAFAMASALSLSHPTPKTFEDLAFGIIPRQSEPSSCGYAVIAGVLNMVKDKDLSLSSGTPGLITEEYLLKRYGKATKTGNHAPLSILDMIYILDGFGVGSVPMKLDVGSLGTALKTTTPLIIHYDRPVSHFVLGLCADGEFLTVVDPECGVVSLHESELAARASGYVLLPLTKRQDEIMRDEKVSAGILAAMDRRAVLTAAADCVRTAAGQQSHATSPFHGEVGVSVGSSGTETGTVAFSPSLFFNAEWAVSGSATLLGNMSIQPALGPMRAEAFEVSSGIEVHGENKEKNQSIGAALLVNARLRAKRQSIGFTESIPEIFSNPDFSSLEPQLKFRFSRIIDPFLLTGSASIRLSFPFPLPAALQPGWKGTSLFSLPIEVSTLCAFSPLLVGKASLEQEFLFPGDGKSPMEWKAAVSCGINIPLDSLLFYAGTKIRLDYGSKTNGEAVFSCTF